jgi:AAA domain
VETLTELELEVLAELEAERAQHRPKWLSERVQSLEQLEHENLPELNWIVEDLLTEGRMALGQSAVKQGRVLYISPDDKQKTRLRTRLRAMRDGRTDSIPFDIATNWTQLDDGGVEELAEYIDYYPDTRLIIIDVIMNVLPGISEDAADNILMLDEDYNTHQRYLLTSGKDLEQRKDPLEFDRTTGVYTYGEARLAELKEKTASQSVVEIVKNSQGITLGAIVKRLVQSGISEAAADKRVTRAAKSGEICSVPGRTGLYPCDNLPHDDIDDEDLD